MRIGFLSIGALSNNKEAMRITTLELAKHYTEQGHDVVIFTERKDGLPQREEIGKVVILRQDNIALQMQKKHSLLYGLFKPIIFPISKIVSPTLTARRYVRNKKESFDILHLLSATPLFVISGLIVKMFSEKSQKKKSKIIHTLKAYSRDRGGNLFYGLLRFADKITVPTKVYKKRLSTSLQQKTKVIYSPLRLEKFMPYSAEKRRALREEYKELLGLQDKDTKVVMHYGSMHKFKGVDYLIKAMPEVIKAILNVRFVFFPRYNNVEHERRLIAEQGASDYVTFVKEDVRIEDFVNLADVVVLPYPSLDGTEGNPSCLLEAMACKTHVISTNLAELHEATEDAIVFAEPKDSNSLAQRIVEVLEHPNPELLEKAFMQSKKFDSAKIAEEFLRLYSD